MSTAPFPSPTSKWHNNTYPSLSPTRPELSAKGKTVLITGGGTGIGAETARIALLGRRAQPLQATKAASERDFPGVDVFAHPADVTSKPDVDAAFAAFLNNGQGRLDVLVSGAAVIGTLAPVRDADPDAFMDAINQNVRVSLPASFILWLASPEARFLKGKFVWSNWDVDELKEHREELESSTKLNIGLGGWPFGNFTSKLNLDA